MSPKIVLKYKNYEILGVSAGYLLLSSLLLCIQLERGFFILIGAFLLCAILIVRMCIKNFCETTITDEAISIRNILLKKTRTYSVNDQKLRLTIVRNNRQYSDRNIAVMYNGKAFSHYRFSNNREMRKFYEATSSLGFGWKNKPK